LQGSRRNFGSFTILIERNPRFCKLRLGTERAVEPRAWEQAAAQEGPEREHPARSAAAREAQ